MPPVRPARPHRRAPVTYRPGVVDKRIPGRLPISDGPPRFLGTFTHYFAALSGETVEPAPMSPWLVPFNLIAFRSWIGRITDDRPNKWLATPIQSTRSFRIFPVRGDFVHHPRVSGALAAAGLKRVRSRNAKKMLVGVKKGAGPKAKAGQKPRCEKNLEPLCSGFAYLTPLLKRC